MTRRISTRLCVTALLALVVAFAATEHASAQTASTSSTTAASTRSRSQDSATQAPATPSFNSPLRAEGGTQWSVYYGLGINQTINNSAENIHLASGGVRWSHMWSAKGRGFLRGHPAFAIEFVPVMAFFTGVPTTWALGANIMYEHHFAASGRVLPVWKLGAGALHATNPIPEGETAFNFTVLTALGVDVMITEKNVLFLGYRFHHVSNANIGNVNPGINVHTIIWGLSFYR